MHGSYTNYLLNQRFEEKFRKEKEAAERLVKELAKVREEKLAKQKAKEGQK